MSILGKIYDALLKFFENEEVKKTLKKILMVFISQIVDYIFEQDKKIDKIDKEIL